MGTTQGRMSSKSLSRGKDGGGDESRTKNRRPVLDLGGGRINRGRNLYKEGVVGRGKGKTTFIWLVSIRSSCVPSQVACGLQPELLRRKEREQTSFG